jgi:CRISPR-associated protein Csd1
MILTKLKEYAEQQMMDKLPPSMYNQRRIAWLISLTADGRFEGSICWKDNSQKETKKGREIVAPDIGRTVGVKPKLLVDTSEYILGIGRSATKPDRLTECHEQFKTLIQTCAEVTNELTIVAISKFLNSSLELEKAREEFSQLLDAKKFDPTENITFRVGGKIPAHADENFLKIQEFWADYTSGGEESESGKIKSHIMTCLVTGEEKAVEQRLPFLVKGLFGGQPSGTALVSANAQAFTSYGLANSLTSPISREAAEKFTKALNHLLSGKNTRLSVGNTAYVFWTREPEEMDLLGAIEHPDPQIVKNLLDSASQGQEVYGTDVNQFYALALSASVARAVVRDWLETTVPTVKANLKLWFLAHKITDAYGEVGKPLGVYALAASAYRDATKEMLPKVPTALIRNALQHLPIPDDLLTRAVQRNRAEGKITYPRAALIKLALTTKLGTDAMTDMEQLNPQTNLQAQDDRAYHCGRLLAELEGLQKAALGKVNASLVDRYYSAASTTPATAFPALMKNSFNHLAKLRKNKVGAYSAIDTRIQEIMLKIAPPSLETHTPTFPKTLKMHQQGLFALGYYHQRAHNRAEATGARVGGGQAQGTAPTD